MEQERKSIREKDGFVESDIKVDKKKESNSKGGNENKRKENDLRKQQSCTRGVAWSIIGDYNVTLSVEEHSAGEFGEFKDSYIEEAGQNYEEYEVHRGVQASKCYFSCGRGLRHGDHISLYLFTMDMEVLNVILKKKIDEKGAFKYHEGCKELKIIHLCFDDDLLVMCNGDIHSLMIIKKALEEFSNCTRLYLNVKKSAMFCGEDKGCLDDGIKEERTVLNGSYRDGCASNEEPQNGLLTYPYEGNVGWAIGLTVMRPYDIVAICSF
nr:RNA-directed DNA polymerase, eukaryota, reverse transcriptase zinc-binding domain protein [Tanacetum cinerariifolium]